MASLLWSWKMWIIRPINTIAYMQPFKQIVQMQPLINNPLWEAILQLNRNARAPKKANHGARPCSSVMRRLRKKGNYKKYKEKTPIEQEEYSATWEDI